VELLSFAECSEVVFRFQSLSDRLKKKSRLLHKVLPELQPARALKAERDVALQRAVQAEARAEKGEQAQKEVQALREEILSLRGSLHGE